MPKNGINVMNHPYSRGEDLSIWCKSWLVYVTCTIATAELAYDGDGKE